MLVVSPAERSKLTQSLLLVAVKKCEVTAIYIASQGSSKGARIKTLEQVNEGKIHAGLNADTDQICNKMDVEPLGSSSALAKQLPSPFLAVHFTPQSYFQSLFFFFLNS